MFKLEKSELIPEDKNSNETSSEINNDEEPNSSVEFLEKSNFQEIVKTSGNSDNLNSKAITHFLIEFWKMVLMVLLQILITNYSLF